MSTLRIGLIGAGSNTKARHIPGLRALPDVEIVAVCNRRLESTRAAAQEFGIPRTFQRWQDLVADPDIDAVVIGTWPYLHCPITLAALEAGKHVLTEARMCMNAGEAHTMLQASHRFKNLVTQIVPSPYGLRGVDYVSELIESGFLGDLREVRVYSQSSALADPAAPLSWRQDVSLSGFNVLTLGIMHETLLRWIAPVVRVLAQAHAFIPTRIDPYSGVRRPAGTPDCMQALGVLADGARVIYQFSGVTPFGQGMGFEFFGSDGTLHYDVKNECIRGASRTRGDQPGSKEDLKNLPIPLDKVREWTVEADFVAAIREAKPVRFTDFATGVAYMEFTEAVARSAQTGTAVDLPLEEYDKRG
jgi:predicted dehydrogenase